MGRFLAITSRGCGIRPTAVASKIVVCGGNSRTRNPKMTSLLRSLFPNASGTRIKQALTHAAAGQAKLRCSAAAQCMGSLSSFGGRFGQMPSPHRFHNSTLTRKDELHEYARI